MASPKWWEKREEIRNNPYWGRPNQCLICHKDSRLSVHHLTYKNVFHEKDEDLCILCSTCHSEIHNFTGEKKHKNIDINVFLYKFKDLLITDSL